MPETRTLRLNDLKLPLAHDEADLRQAVAAALAVFSSGRYYAVSWLGERITGDLRNAVYGHVLQQSPAFFETTQSGEVLSRLTNDTTLVQTVVGSSFSMGLRNLVMGAGALLMLVWTNPMLMLQVVAVLVVVIFPSVYLGRRVRRLSRASQDRVADASAIASEVLNAITVVQSYTAEDRETRRFVEPTVQPFLAVVGDADPHDGPDDPDHDGKYHHGRESGNHPRLDRKIFKRAATFDHLTMHDLGATRLFLAELPIGCLACSHRITRRLATN